MILKKHESVGPLFRRVETAARATNKQRHPGAGKQNCSAGPSLRVTLIPFFLGLEEESI